MSTIAQPRRRGRPPAHPVDKVRTKLWFNAVKKISGLSSAYAIEMHLDGNRVHKNSDSVNRPRKWDGYEKGEKTPKDVPDERNAIEQAETAFAGTAHYFRSPLWAF